MQFFRKDDGLPILVALVMGLQHAFAMVGGLIVPPYVVMRFAVGGDADMQQYAIACSLILSGLFTILNCIQFNIPGTKYVFGTGMLSVLGTSFGFLPIYENAIEAMRAETNADGTGKYSGKEAYGKMLGTTMVCAMLEVVLSFVPRDKLRRMFPNIVTGVAVMLIGAGLTATGIKYWGGGAVCAEMAWKNNGQVYGLVGKGGTWFGPDQTGVAPFPGGGGRSMCDGNGDVVKPFGSTEYIALGFSVVLMLILVELFGSPFMKNANVIIALLFGYFVAGVSRAEGNKFVPDTKIENAEPITFAWVENFPIGFYGPAVLPLLIAFLVTTVETIGDLSATYEASEEDTESEEFDKSVQGGLLSDGVCSFGAALATGMPNTTFSQNNGVIALTKCASRRAGVCCGLWLIALGVLSKVSGIISSMPDCVVGGMTTFLFCNVFVSGLSVVSKADLNSRRNRIILAISMGVGLGVTAVPWIFGDQRASSGTAPFWACTGPFREGGDCSKGEQGIRDGILILLTTPYSIGTLLAMALHAILPTDMEVVGYSADGGKA
jgi:NCS2 family nucleobase:cation symporter-2